MERIINLVRDFLDTEEYKYVEKKMKASHHFILGFNRFRVRVDISENGEFLAIYSKGVWDKDILLEQDEDFKMRLFIRILGENYSNKLSKWSFDSEDGDLVLSVEIPIEDGTLTYNQFRRAFEYVLLDSNSLFPDVYKQIIL